MTPAERALLLAVAKSPMVQNHATWLRPLIVAVEAEAAPEAPAKDKSCETCDWFDKERKVSCAIFVGDCDGESKWKAIKPTEADVCPTCKGLTWAVGWSGENPCKDTCPDCNGTGKKENK